MVGRSVCHNFLKVTLPCFQALHNITANLYLPVSEKGREEVAYKTLIAQKPLLLPSAFTYYFFAGVNPKHLRDFLSIRSHKNAPQVLL